MPEKIELREKIAGIICNYGGVCRDCQFYNEFPDCFSDIKEKTEQLEALFAQWAKEQGMVTPEDCERCQESQKIVTREASFEGERLREEVRYWKDKNYELGGG